jgi:hypothetical protein
MSQQLELVHERGTSALKVRSVRDRVTKWLMSSNPAADTRDCSRIVRFNRDLNVEMDWSAMSTRGTLAYG